MKPYLITLAAGLLVGVIYSLLRVKSPAPPLIALTGLFAILVGEQIIPVIRHAVGGMSVAKAVSSVCAKPMLGRLPGDPNALTCAKAEDAGSSRAAGATRS